MPVLRDRQIIYAALAAQIDLLHDLITGQTLFERLWYVAEILPGLIKALAPGGDFVAAAQELDTELDRLSLLQAQHFDFARQSAEAVRRALHVLAQARGATLTLQELEKLYVSDSQRIVHRRVLERQAPQESNHERDDGDRYGFSPADARGS